MPGTEDDPNSREVPWHNYYNISSLSLLLLGALAPGQPVLASRTDEGEVKNLGNSNLTPPIIGGDTVDCFGRCHRREWRDGHVHLLCRS